LGTGDHIAKYTNGNRWYPLQATHYLPTAKPRHAIGPPTSEFESLLKRTIGQFVNLNLLNIQIIFQLLHLSNNGTIPHNQLPQMMRLIPGSRFQKTLGRRYGAERISNSSSWKLSKSPLAV
jgi:hypothetical protein